MTLEAITDILRGYIEDGERLKLAATEIALALAENARPRPFDETIVHAAKAENFAAAAERLARPSTSGESAIVRALLALYHQREADR